jgi:hypothetical protein
MSRSTVEFDAWHPQTQEERQAVLQELKEVLASPHFCNSKRYPALLRFVVENTLDGKSSLLKERTLGIEVFDRPPDYDTNSDTVVRYTAGEVRKRLQLYYLEHPAHSGPRISLPAGSYVPEFLVGSGKSELDAADPESAPVPDTDFRGEFNSDSHLNGNGSGDLYGNTKLESGLPRTSEIEAVREVELRKRTGALRTPAVWLGAAAMTVVVAVIALMSWRSRAVRSETDVSDFWMPVVRENHSVLLCTGSVVFAKNDFSGVTTAGKDIDYPFVSMQIAASISEISATLSQLGVSTQLLSAASTPLTDLREHSVTLLGGYNNDWTMRLLQPLRFHFTPEPVESIVDQLHPGTQWQRNHALPYSSADDYALLARFRDPTIDGWVVVVAGLGRNGTEAASQFAVSPHYMHLLRDQVGHDLAKQNLEVLLKVKVIDGKTGAPSIVAIHTW